MLKGAMFSCCRRYRFALWRIWDESKPIVMFIGLNPSTANESEPDNTIKSVVRIASNNGYGGVYMMNCFTFVSTDPDSINYHGYQDYNNQLLQDIGKKCKDIIFAWGNFSIVKEVCRNIQLHSMFPNALCLGQNKNGSPKHPLYQKATTKFVKYKY